MRSRKRLVATTGLVFALAVAPALAADAPAYQAPRTAFGDPDLQGLWTNASLTPLERPRALNKLVLTVGEARTIEAAINRRRSDDNRDTDPAAGAPAAGVAVRGYNAAWTDQGTKLGVVNGEIRSSWIVDSPDGRVPYSPAGLAQMRRAGAALRSFDGPEVRSLGERCVLGFGSTSGPPMLNVLYNNHYQIAQSPGHVVIVIEMNHDARIIRLGGRHPPPDVRLWMGDSIGRWDGATLVVETSNLHPAQLYSADSRNRLYLGANTTITERFTRVGRDELRYEFSVEDPVVYTRPWRAEMPFRATAGPMYEYACHEGNHSMAGILRGARYEEAQRAAATGGTR